MQSSSKFSVPKYPKEEVWTIEEISDIFMMKEEVESKYLHDLPDYRKIEIMNTQFRGFDKETGPKQFLKQVHQIVNNTPKYVKPQKKSTCYDSIIS